MYEIAVFCRNSLTEESCNSIHSFLLSQQCSDGGFQGRSKESDLYYTAFALASFFCRYCKTEFPSKGLPKAKKEANLDFIHLCSLLRCYNLLSLLSYPSIKEEKRQKILSFVERYRSLDGGYHHEIPGNEHASLYGCFLAYQTYLMQGQIVPHFFSCISSIDTLKSQDGSYSNQPGLPSGNTTSTSAAMILLDAAGKKSSADLIPWILLHRHTSGGFLATQKSSIPDLLSTSVALYALYTVHYPLDSIKSPSLEFIESHWEETGGFLGTILDPIADCEYTFYALLALGVLHINLEEKSNSCKIME